MAVIGGQINIVNQLLDMGADMEARDGDHMTPVHRYIVTYGLLIAGAKHQVLMLNFQDHSTVFPHDHLNS